MTAAAAPPTLTWATASAARGPVRRIALYSHDTQGLGHVRRNLRIAHALSRTLGEPDILLLAGAPEAQGFPLPARTDVLTLPGLRKDRRGRYGSRSLSLPLHRLIDLRAGVMLAAVNSFDPDVLIVDKVARGAFGELQPVLDLLARRRSTRLVLGLRDVLDDAFTVRREWRQEAFTEAVEDHYDAVWVYGDASVYDPVREYRLPRRVADKVHFTGFLVPPVPPDSSVPPSSPPYDLCLVGGGQDGFRTAAAFLEADHPTGTAAVVVAGPHMGAEARAELDELAAGRPDRQVHGFVRDCAQLLRHARAVVAMGGYNTTMELLAHGRPALIVPRVRPRREQLIRAERLASRGLVEVVHPDAFGPATLTQWLAAPRPPLPARGRIDVDGFARLPALVGAVCPPRTATDTGVLHAAR